MPSHQQVSAEIAAGMTEIVSADAESLHANPAFDDAAKVHVGGIETVQWATDQHPQDLGSGSLRPSWVMLVKASGRLAGKGLRRLLGRRTVVPNTRLRVDDLLEKLRTLHQGRRHCFQMMI